MKTEEVSEEQGMKPPRSVYRGQFEFARGKNAPLEVIEFLPQIRMCKFHLWGRQFQHWLALPYMQFTRYWYGGRVSLHISFSNDPIDKITDIVYFPPLPNVWYPNLQCCLMHSPSDSYQHMMTYFWNTRYLDCEDWYSFPILDKETPMRTYKNWEKMTREDPSFILDVEWTQPALISEIPFDDHGISHTHKFNSEYGNCDTNRPDGIRNFAVVRSKGPGF